LGGPLYCYKTSPFKTENGRKLLSSTPFYLKHLITCDH